MDDALDETVPIFPIVTEDGGRPEKADEPAQEAPAEGSLCDMAKDGYVFFTTALILTHGLLDRDPVAEFERTHTTNDPATRCQAIDCEYPFFEGLGMGVLGNALVNWDHRLYAVVPETWVECKSFLEAICAFSTKKQHYFRTGSYQLNIVDPIAFHGFGVGRYGGELPVIEVNVFCVATNRLFAWIAPPENPPLTLPSICLGPPRPEVIPEAAAVLGPPPAPHDLAKFREGLNADDHHRIAALNRSQRGQV